MASGKTTLINKIAELDPEKYVFLKEEITPNQINDFYDTGMKYALESELRIFFNELFKFRTAKDSDKIYLFDRTYMDTYVFIQALHRYSKISNVDKRFFNEIYHAMTEDLISPFDYYIYLNTNVEYLYDNMVSRDRKSEMVVDKEYLEILNWSFEQTWKHLHDLHDREVEALGGRFIYLRHFTVTNEKHNHRVIQSLHEAFTEPNIGRPWMEMEL